MRKLQFFAVPSVVLVVAVLGAHVAAAAPTDKPGYALTFDDEFDGGSLDLTKWVRRYKWGEGVINGELEAYIDDAFVEQNGILSIVGKHEQGQYAGQTLDYTSGVICSIHEQTYGYFESRLKVPKGQGLWPAFWLLGAIGTAGVNEIDIHEILGNATTTANMTVHWGQSYTVGHQADGSTFTGPDFSADFHTFGLEWDPDKIVWTIDGVPRKTHTGDGVPQVDMYVILNLAIGGGWPGAPDSTTPFPSDYDIDYVRAYERVADAGIDGATAGGSTMDAAAAAGGAASGAAGAGTTSTGGVSASGGAAGMTTGGITSAGGASSTGGAGGGAQSIDGGTTSKASSSGGCGCRVQGSRADSSPFGVAALAALILGSRLGRRRRSAGSRC